MTTVAYASSVRPNVNVMLPKGHAHGSKEEEMLTPQLVSVRRLQRHVAILSQRERLFHHRCYLQRHQRATRKLPRIASGKLSLELGIHWVETEVRNDLLKIHLMIQEPLGARTQR